jgi:hypothetical protein
MIKLTKKSIIITTIIILVVLLIFRAYISSRADNSNLWLADFNARKEDLILKQEQLQNIIINLNTTLQQEVAKQNELLNKLTSIGGKPSGSVSSGSSSSSLPSPAPAPAPTPAPPVTRAS